jgi:hypothetical protein
LHGAFVSQCKTAANKTCWQRKNNKFIQKGLLIYNTSEDMCVGVSYPHLFSIIFYPLGELAELSEYGHGPVFGRALFHVDADGF